MSGRNPRASRSGSNRLFGQAETPVRTNASFCRHRLHQSQNRCFRVKPREPVLDIRVIVVDRDCLDHSRPVKVCRSAGLARLLLVFDNAYA